MGDGLLEAKPSVAIARDFLGKYLGKIGKYGDFCRQEPYPLVSDYHYQIPGGESP
jgi:hypothetical protein